MKKVKFPVVGKGKWIFPKNSDKCPMCGNLTAAWGEGGKLEQVVLTVGALRKVGEDEYSGNVEENKDLAGIMTVTTHTHGDSKRRNATVDVVELSAGGQADIKVCSTKCLRKFFGSIVDELEKKKGK